MNGRNLQSEIDLAMRGYDSTPIKRIELGRGSDVMNLSRNVDVRAFLETGESREFFIMTTDLVALVFSSRVDGGVDPKMDDVYTPGKPIIIVLKITGDSIVRGLLRYLELEEGRVSA